MSFVHYLEKNIIASRSTRGADSSSLRVWKKEVTRRLQNCFNLSALSLLRRPQACVALQHHSSYPVSSDQRA
ncbi:hypothetical protein RRG08_000613 [Elysia crispata]|uniref:Uncharacterized protein n=1 Tax=Elysia crispata TaxID=231223 RepID=A0AAE1CUI2_9GAST|nr:hypothetical protein RRG08_000613 [Elysia crispata]